MYIYYNNILMCYIVFIYFKYWINIDIFVIKMCDFVVFILKLNNCNIVLISNIGVDKFINRNLLFRENKKEIMCWG